MAAEPQDCLKSRTVANKFCYSLQHGSFDGERNIDELLQIPARADVKFPVTLIRNAG